MPRIIPQITDINNRGMDQSYDIFSRLLKERIIFVTGEIEETSANIICAQLLALELESPRDIIMYINSPGGVLYEALAIIDIMQIIQNKGIKIKTIGNGFVASAAALIISCGTRNHRTVTKHCRLMVHQPLGGTQGQVTDMEIQIKEALLLKQKTAEILSQQTGQPMQTVIESMERDRYLSAQEAKDFGLIDGELHQEEFQESSNK